MNTEDNNRRIIFIRDTPTSLTSKLSEEEEKRIALTSRRDPLSCPDCGSNHVIEEIFYGDSHKSDYSCDQCSRVFRIYWN
jgi:transposase-like protein